MATMNVGAAIGPAISHTKRVLFGPFALRKWLALGFVSLIAEFGQGGARINWPSDSSGSDEIGRTLYQWVEHHLTLIIAGAVLLFLIGLALQWLGSVMRFVYLNQITRDPYAIREPFARLKHLGTSLFLWRLAFTLIAVLAMALLVGLPVLGLFMAQLTSNTSRAIASTAISVNASLHRNMPLTWQTARVS